MSHLVAGLRVTQGFGSGIRQTVDLMQKPNFVLQSSAYEEATKS